MSYTVLARRYRSTTFDEVIGQEHVAQTLKRAISTDRIAHAYLFCGTRGTGKTSMARILAKALNCHKFDKPTPTPCGECDSCKAIARGDDIDVIEIDAASNTGVENVRDIIANAGYSPARSRFKVYIIDEVHALSKNAFNALLKTLEEPPKHVKFILATTEAEKVLQTILSRCQRYDFRNIPTREIAAHLKEICKKEGVRADDDALFLVAKSGAGSMRDSLSLLDRLLSIGESTLTVHVIETLLGMPRSQIIFDLAQHIGLGDVKGTLELAGKVTRDGLSPDTLIASLIDHLRNLLIINTCGIESQLVEVPGLPPGELVEQAGKFEPAILSQDIAVLEELRRQLRSSQAGRALLDATLVRLALAAQFTPIDRLLGSIGDDETDAPALKKKHEVNGASNGAGNSNGGITIPPYGNGASSLVGRDGNPAAERSSAAPASRPRESETPAEAGVDRLGTAGSAGASPSRNSASPAPVARGPLDDDDDDLPRPGKVWDSEGPSLAELMKQQERAAAESQKAHVANAGISENRNSNEAAPSAQGTPSTSARSLSNVERVPETELPRVWQAMMDLLDQKSASLPPLLKGATLTGIEDGLAVVRFPNELKTFLTMFDRNGKKEMVRDALTSVMERPIGIRMELDPVETRIAAPAVPIAPTEAAPPRQTPIAPTTVTRATPSAPMRSAPQPAEASPQIRITDELKQSLRATEPLIDMLVKELGAEIVKVE